MSKIYRVSIVYKPKFDGEDSCGEVLRFATEAAAREFAARQNKLSQVLSAKYIGFSERD